MRCTCYCKTIYCVAIRDEANLALLTVTTYLSKAMMLVRDNSLPLLQTLNLSICSSISRYVSLVRGTGSIADHGAAPRNWCRAVHTIIWRASLGSEHGVFEVGDTTRAMVVDSEPPSWS
jgi:hypothetical protein